MSNGRGYAAGTAYWQCSNGHEWSSPAREYPPETEHDVHMITAEGQGDTCPICGKTDADSVEFIED